MVTANVLSSQNSQRRRSFLSGLMLFSLGVLVLGILGMTLVYAFPNQEFFIVGSITRFPPSENPYLIRTDRSMFWLVNKEGQYLALSQQHPLNPHCAIGWSSEMHYFIDPCLATQFWLDGTYAQKGPPANMDRYQVELQNGEIIVNLSDMLPPVPVIINW